MKPACEHSFQNASKPESDPIASLEKLWRELDDLEKLTVNANHGHCKVRLDCSDQLVPLGSVVLLASRDSVSWTELIEFVCPRCNRRHESLRFAEQGPPVPDRALQR